MEAKKSLISIRDLRVEYDNTTALEGVNLDIYEDDFLGVIGPNGGGKSSLVKAIMGTIPYKGRIEFDASLKRGNHYKIGYMPQVSEFDMRFPISIREVVLSGLQTEKGFFGRYTSQDKARADALLEKMGIEFNEETAKYDAKGNLTICYLKDEVCGFALHIVKKK